MSEYLHARCGGVLVEEFHHVHGWVRIPGTQRDELGITPSSEPLSDVGRCEKCGRVGIMVEVPHDK